MDAHLESTALRFHKRLKRYHKVGLAYNLALGNMWMSFYHLFAYTVESFAVEAHKRDVRPQKATLWEEKRPGVHIRSI